MTELLVVFSCLHGSGCSETSQTYVFYNPDSVQIIENYKQQVPQFVIVAAPYVGAVLQQEINVSLGKGLSVKTNKSVLVISFDKTF